jgi:hypothetical protein
LGIGYHTLTNKFQGWDWRTKLYIKAIKEVPENKLILLTDSNDLYFVRPAEEMIKVFNDGDYKVTPTSLF